MKRAALILIPIFLILSIGLTVYLVVTQRLEIRKKAAPAVCPTTLDNFKPTNGSIANQDKVYTYTITNYNEFTPSARRIYLYTDSYQEIARVDNQQSLTYDFAANGKCGKFIFTHHLEYKGCNVCSFYPSEGKPPVGVRPACAPPSPTCAQGSCRGFNADWSLPADGFAVDVSCETLPSATPPAATRPPIPTATVTVRATATPTPTKTVTPTSGIGAPNSKPVCTGLSASPTSGTIPATVHFVGSGTDADGSVKKFEFTYGDGKNQTIEKDVGDSGSVEIDHTYTVSGSFVTSLRVQDNNNSWSDATDKCAVTITTTGGPTVTPSPTSATIAQKGGVAPTATRTPTPTKTASASATPVQPDVPTAGSLLPTLMIGLGGVLILGLGLLLAL